VNEVFPVISRIKGIALDFLFPQKCVGCGREGALICSDCRNKLPRIGYPVCPKCGRYQSSGIICPDCVDWQNSIDGIRSPFRFEGIIRDSIHLLKYKNLRDISGILSELLFLYLGNNPINFDLIIPVPLHPKKLKDRGYNQSELIARKLSELTHLSADTFSLIRTRYSIPQVKTAGKEDRLHEIKGAYSCIHNNNLKNKSILLIDDVATSGATLDECAKTLKTAGAAEVWGLTAAREI
jgi:ComF family protein